MSNEIVGLINISTGAGIPDADIRYTQLTTTSAISGNLQTQIDTIELTPGPQGVPGISGSQGIQGIQGARGGSTWTPNLLNVTQDSVDSTKFIKTGGLSDWGNAQIYSTQCYTRGAFCSATITTTNDNSMFGLNSDPTRDASYDSIDFAFYSALGTLYIYEEGVSQGTFGTYTTSTVLTITYDGVNVRYWIDGSNVRTVARAIGLPLYLDSSIYQLGAGFANLVFGPMGEKGVDVDSSLYTLLTTTSSISGSLLNDINTRALDTNAVHITGNESISGNKTFVDSVIIGTDPPGGSEKLRVGGAIKAINFNSNGGNYGFDHSIYSVDSAAAFRCYNGNSGSFLTVGTMGNNAYGIQDWGNANVIESVGSVPGSGNLILSSYYGDTIFQVNNRTIDALKIKRNGSLIIGSDPGGSEKLRVDGDIKTAGDIYSNSLISSGTVSANIISTGNIWESATNATAAVSINYYGYSNGATQFRNFDIYNGKQSRIASLEGSTGHLGVLGTLSVGSLTLVGGGCASFSGGSLPIPAPAGSVLIGGGTIQAANTIVAGSNVACGNGSFFYAGASGSAIPAFNTRSTGTKIVLYDTITESLSDAAIGIEPNYMWFSMPSSSTGWKWYGGTTNIATLTGLGGFTCASLTATEGVSCTSATVSGVINTVSISSKSFRTSMDGNNEMFGLDALISNTNGTLNSAFGYQSMYGNTTGDNNTAIGRSSLQNNESGSENTAVGVSALEPVIDGYHNTAIGAFSGVNSFIGDIDTNECTFLGAYCTASVAGLVNSTAIGYGATVSQSNQVVLGNPNITSTQVRGLTQPQRTIAASNSTGTVGEICWDSSYVYVCVDTNTWKRSEITTW